MSLTRKTDVGSTLSQTATAVSRWAHWVAYVIDIALEYVVTAAGDSVICDLASGDLSRTTTGASPLVRTAAGETRWR